MKKILSILLIITLTGGQNIYALGSMLAPAGFSETGYDGLNVDWAGDKDFLESKARLENLDIERHKVKFIKGREQKKAAYIKIINELNNELINENSSRAIPIGAYNCRGYCANEIARLALFEIRDLVKLIDDSNEKEIKNKIEHLSHEIDNWITAFSMPSFRYIIDKNRSESQLKIGYARGCSGYSFAMDIRTQHDLELADLYPDKKREYMKKTFLHTASALRYGVKGLENDPKNDHSCSATVSAVERLARVMEYLEDVPIETISQASYRDNLFKGILSLLDEIKEVPGLGGLKKGYLAIINGKVQEAYEKADIIVRAEESLVDIFVKAARENKIYEDFNSVDDFKELLELYIEDLYPEMHKIIIPAMENWKYDLFDISIVRIVAAETNNKSSIKELYNNVNRLDYNITPNILKAKVEGGAYAWLGLQLELINENSADANTGSKKTLRLRSAKREFARYREKLNKYMRFVCEKPEGLIEGLRPWISVGEIRRLEYMYCKAKEKLDMFGIDVERVSKLSDNNDVKIGDLERLYSNSVGTARYPGYKKEIDLLMEKADQKIDHVIKNNIGKMSDEIAILKKKAAYLVEIAGVEDTRSLLRHIIDAKKRLMQIFDRGSRYFLSKDLHQELKEELDSIKEDIGILEPRIRYLGDLRKRINTAKSSVPDSIAGEKKIISAVSLAEELLAKIENEFGNPDSNLHNNSEFLTTVKELEASIKDCVSISQTIRNEAVAETKLIDALIERLDIQISTVIEEEMREKHIAVKNMLIEVKEDINMKSEVMLDKPEWDIIIAGANKSLDRCDKILANIESTIRTISLDIEDNIGNTMWKLPEGTKAIDVSRKVKKILKNRVAKKEISRTFERIIINMNISFVRLESDSDSKSAKTHNKRKSLMKIGLSRDNNGYPDGVSSATIYFWGDEKDNYLDIVNFLVMLGLMGNVISGKNISPGDVEKLIMSDYMRLFARIFVCSNATQVFKLKKAEDLPNGIETMFQFTAMLKKRGKFRKVEALLKKSNKNWDISEYITAHKELLRNNYVKICYFVAFKNKGFTAESIFESEPDAMFAYIMIKSILNKNDPNRLGLADLTPEMVRKELDMAIKKHKMNIEEELLELMCENISALPGSMICSAVVLTVVVSILSDKQMAYNFTKVDIGLKCRMGEKYITEYKMPPKSIARSIFSGL